MTMIGASSISGFFLGDRIGNIMLLFFFIIIFVIVFGIARFAFAGEPPIPHCGVCVCP